TVFVGIIVGIVSNATQSLGITLQRKSHILKELNSDPTSNSNRSHIKILWRTGFLLFIIANVFGSSIQISTLPLIILSPLQATGLVFNSILASVILKENFTKKTLLGTILVSIGAFLIAYFGSLPQPQRSLIDLINLFKRIQFLHWLLSSFIIAIVINISLPSISNLKEYLTRNLKIFFKRFKSFDYPLYEKLLFIQGILFGLISGLLSAHALLLAKSAVEILVNAIVSHKPDDLKNLDSWVIVVIWFCFAVAQLYYLNLGLKITSTTIVYPLTFCVFNVVNILNGLIYFDQLEKLDNIDIFFIFFGVLLIVIGVSSLSWNFND
ncbi:uncharacterized protein ASCRUDRAFT_24179, partial [Ascoidea rubescens DSM 1968]